MNKLTNKQKITILVFVIIIVAGIIVAFTSGFNFDLNLQETKKVDLYIENTFEESDIRNITNDVFGNQEVIIQKVEVYEDSLRIIAKDITEEQKNKLVEKINERYGLEISKENTEIITIPNTKGIDLLKPYILPFIIATVIILAYMMIKYRELGMIKTLVKVVAVLIISEVTLFSLIAITRIPIGILTMPMVIAVYLLILTLITFKLENELKNKKDEKENIE